MRFNHRVQAASCEVIMAPIAPNLRRRELEVVVAATKRRSCNGDDGVRRFHGSLAPLLCVCRIAQRRLRVLHLLSISLGYVGLGPGAQVGAAATSLSRRQERAAEVKLLKPRIHRMRPLMRRWFDGQPACRALSG